MKKILTILLVALVWFLLYIWGYVQAGIKYIPPHYHANFAMYVNGERIEFTDPKYSEDVAGCSISGEIVPEDRAHLHENNQDTIHIHAPWVSWGHFFANNGFAFWADYLILDSGDKYFNTQSAQVQYVLNGKLVRNPYNKNISSKDRLLINYWDVSEEGLMDLYNTVSDNAGIFNDKYDPGSCWWTNENGIWVLLTQWVHWLHDMEH